MVFKEVSKQRNGTLSVLNIKEKCILQKVSFDLNFFIIFFIIYYTKFLKIFFHKSYFEKQLSDASQGIRNVFFGAVMIRSIKNVFLYLL